MKDVEKTQDSLRLALERLQHIQDAYSPEAKSFLDFVHERSSLSPTTINLYIQNLQQSTVKNGSSSMAAETYNKHIKAIKNRIRKLLESQKLFLSEIERYQIEDYLKSIKLKKVQIHAKTDDEIPAKNEMGLLLASAPKRLSLIMEFILYTGARISEVLNTTVGDAVKKNKTTVTVRILGKGNKERKAYVPRPLWNRIIEAFDEDQRYWLFQHDGKQYNRNAITNQVRQISGEVLGKKISPHDIRHRIGTDLTKEYGLWAAADYLGHASIQTTNRIYNHNRVTARDVRDLYRGE